MSEENNSLQSIPARMSPEEILSAATQVTPADSAQVEATSMSAKEVCETLVGKIKPEYRERYLSGKSTPRTKEKTKQLQRLILSMVRRGPIRDCIEELARKQLSGNNYGEVERDSTNNILRPLDSTERVSLTDAANDLFTLANDDDDFAFLCSLFDKTIEQEFPSIVGAWIQVYRASSRNQSMSHLMKDILEHAEGKCFGVKNPAEHEKRETALFQLSKVVGMAREAYGLTPYSQIQGSCE